MVSAGWQRDERACWTQRGVQGSSERGRPAVKHRNKSEATANKEATQC